MRHPLFAIQHIGLELVAADLPAARRFWALLGLSELVVPPSLAGRAVWLGGPGGQVHLLVVERGPTPAGTHVALEIGDRLEAVVTALRAEGFKVQERRAHWGATRMLALAPGGHRVELMAQAPPSLPVGTSRQ